MTTNFIQKLYIIAINIPHYHFIDKKLFELYTLCFDVSNNQDYDRVWLENDNSKVVHWPMLAAWINVILILILYFISTWTTSPNLILLLFICAFRCTLSASITWYFCQISVTTKLNQIGIYVHLQTPNTDYTYVSTNYYLYL